MKWCGARNLNPTMASNTVADQEDAYMEDSFTGEIPVKGGVTIRRGTTNVVIDEDHPFDLEAYISNYDRTCLVFISPFW